MTLTLSSSTQYTNGNASAVAWFTIEARDIYTNQPVPQVAVTAILRLSRDDAVSDPRGRFPYNVSVVTARSGRQIIRTAAVALGRSRRGRGVQVIFQIVKVQHAVYLMGSKPMLKAATPLL